MYNCVKAMCSKIDVQPQFNTPVTGMVMDPNDSLGQSINVTYVSNGSPQVSTYSAVFNSTNLGCFGQMNLGGLPIKSDPFSQWTAIRSLSYDSAGKVAIKFKTAWWISEGNMNKLGGVSMTDFPICVTVCPSWMDTDDKLGSLISQASPNGEDQLMQLILKNLVEMFDNPAITYNFLTSQVNDHHAFE